MKQRILTLMAALMTLCLFLELSPPSARNTSLAWVHWDSLTGRDNFYFKKRQWLADARTIVAGVHFLYECETAKSTDSMNVATVPRAPRPRAGISTNLIGAEVTVTPLTPVGKRLSRAERIIGRVRLSSRYGLPPMFAFAEFPSNSLVDRTFPGLEAKGKGSQGPASLQRL